MEWIESLSPYPTTMGIVYRFTYDRRPGLLIRFTPVITGESPWYLMPIRSMNLARFQIFHSTHIAFLKKNFCNSKFQPRMRKFTTRKPAMDAFFICANKSPTGSFTIYLLVCASSALPRHLYYSRQVSFVRKSAKTQSTDTELSHVRTRSAAKRTPVAVADLKFCFLKFDDI